MLLFVDNLINVDFSYLDVQRGLVGETWLASVELEGELDAQGMICDFGIVKKIIREWLDTQIDHRLLIPSLSAALIENSKAEACSLRWRYKQGEISLNSPQSALNFIPVNSINADDVAAWCVTQLMPLFPASVVNVKLHFKTESIDGPFYHYSHGLKKHLGNCQRIAHGHRSKIEIWINDELAADEMHKWAKYWQDIYIASEEDLVDVSDTEFVFAYLAQQGQFKISLPKSAVYSINSDSTVELIAEHIAQKLKQRYPEDRIRVKAYEGLGKGAIAQV